MKERIEQLDHWMQAREDEHLEFKEAKQGFDFEELVKYCVALANEGGGKMILGVTDKMPRRIVSTQAFKGLERTKGLDRETNKTLLLKHIQDNQVVGSKMAEFRQVLPSHSRSQIQVLLRELVREHRIHVHGKTQGALWYPGPEAPNCNH